MKALLVLSVLVPVSLLVTFRLTGVLAGPQKPQKPESITAEAVEWSQERPADTVRINDSVVNDYTGGGVSVELRASLDQYLVGFGYGGRSYIDIALSGNASVLNGSVETARVVLSDRDKSTQVNAPNSDLWTMRNLTISDLASEGTDDYKLVNDTKAYLTFATVNRPSDVFFKLFVDWILSSPSNQSDSLDAALELTYRSGEAYETLVLPLRLNLVAYNNNSFETAMEIHDGNYTRLYIGGADVSDYYKVYRVAGQRIKVSADSSAWRPSALFTMYLYDPQRNPMASATSIPRWVQSIEFTTNSTGYWYIEVRHDYVDGLYSLGVSQ